eukprot:TRINITY_DN3501_c0_g1_i1.p1 TRINITY_DN3501_c0_g1~~TRINITY_DN3501_c0_g1_i1.p1  ORF type:complete len:332 (+),score=22.09 TRINITY_DN3501_c0_g1_i1:55-1050(+)
MMASRTRKTPQAASDGDPPCMYVLDPAGRSTGVYGIYIPWHSILETRALLQYATSQKPPSLCMLFQAGHCHMGALCQQVHAEPGAVEQLRAQCSTQGTCCPEHGEGGAAFQRQNAPVVLMTDKQSEPIPVRLSSLARTSCLEKVLRAKPGRTPSFARSQVCRLHQKFMCSYGKECRHIHVCRQLWASLQSDVQSIEKPSKVPVPSTVATASSNVAPQQVACAATPSAPIGAPIAIPTTNSFEGEGCDMPSVPSYRGLGGFADLASTPKSITPNTALRGFASHFVAPESPTQTFLHMVLDPTEAAQGYQKTPAVQDDPAEPHKHLKLQLAGI